MGEWELVPIAASDTAFDELWSFSEDNNLYRIRQDTIIDTAYYFLEDEYNSLFISIHSLDFYTDGNYSVKELSDRILIIEQVNPYIHKEFVKN